ncbi:MAG: MerR family transcriptional regulator, partial [Planctomycetota bacterium]
MAGMFYSIEEVAQKLNKTEDQVSELVQSGRLREFRDGSNVLFKINEVEALLADTSVMASQEPAAEAKAKAEDAADDDFLSIAEPADDEEDISLAAEPELEDDSLELDDGSGLMELEDDLDSTGSDDGADSFGLEDDLDSLESGDDSDSLGLGDESGSKGPGDDSDSLGLGDASALGDESDSLAGLTEADTAMGQDGVNVLGETDSYELSDDTLAETQAAIDEASLEEIEGDVNLDTFGSGSGLLDLSLQADDTSLGGILDEIYTPEGEDGDAKNEGSAVEVAAEAEQMMAEETLNGRAGMMAYAEPEPDAMSNALGITLLLPIAAVIYTTAVALAASGGTLLKIVESTQGMI